MSRKRRTEEEETSYWLSYSDMMAALLLVFVLIISFTMLQAKAQYEEKEKELEGQKTLIAEQESIVQDQKKVMKEQREQIEKIIGVKTEIVSAIKKEFKNSKLDIDIDSETGAITFDSDLLFDPDSKVLKDSSKKFLKKFLPMYFSTLLDPKYADNIAEIIIEGHTAKYGSYIGCLTLSQDRAFAVAEYALSKESNLEKHVNIETVRKIITVNGRAYYDPILDKNGKYDEVNSRRVEIKFRLKDEDMVDEMRDILEKE